MNITHPKEVSSRDKPPKQERLTIPSSEVSSWENLTCLLHSNEVMQFQEVWQSSLCPSWFPPRLRVIIVITWSTWLEQVSQGFVDGVRSLNKLLQRTLHALVQAQIGILPALKFSFPWVAHSNRILFWSHTRKGNPRWAWGTLGVYATLVCIQTQLFTYQRWCLPTRPLLCT